MTRRIDRKMGTNTQLAHIGNDPRDFHGFVNPPVVHASTVLFPDAATMAGRSQKYTYGTRGTPTSDALCTAIDHLEGSAGTVAVPSGLVAALATSPGSGAAVATVGDRDQPLTACWRRSAATPLLRAAFDAGERAPRKVLPALAVHVGELRRAERVASLGTELCHDRRIATRPSHSRALISSAALHGRDNPPREG